jgi:thiamine biosynthesis lipoprotein
LEQVFDYFQSVDERFSTYRDTSEISAINRRELSQAQFSPAMRSVFALAEQTRQETGGYFDIERGGRYDPSGLVKGWAINNAAELLRAAGLANYYVEAGGDIQVAGHNAPGQPWRVGIQRPFQPDQIVKVLALTDCGVATSGDYVRGTHIYRPGQAGALASAVVSLTVIGPNIYEADRFATAAFAMGPAGIQFIDSLDGFEGYLIDRAGQATFTRGFTRYISHA